VLRVMGFADGAGLGLSTARLGSGYVGHRFSPRRATAPCWAYREKGFLAAPSDHPSTRGEADHR
jgi:hypothetical protein